MGIDADGWHAHTRGHDGDALSVLGIAGIAKDATDVGNLLDVMQEIVGDEFGS